MRRPLKSITIYAIKAETSIMVKSGDFVSWKYEGWLELIAGQPDFGFFLRLHDIQNLAF